MISSTQRFIFLLGCERSGSTWLTVDVLKVARGPFLEGGGGRKAYVVEANVATQRPIRVGAASVSEVEIVSGLAEGDRIIISDTTRFEDARRVYLRQ